MTLLMTYAFLIASLLGLSAIFGERGCTEFRWPRRTPWAIAVVGSLLLPAWTMLFADGPADSRVLSVPSLVDAAPLESSPGVGAAAPTALQVSWPTLPGSSGLQLVDSLLAYLWIASSAAALLILGLAALRLRGMLRQCETRVVRADQVLISENLGPAVCGCFRPHVVLPRWLADGPSSLRSMVLSHERAHIAARDQTLFLGAVLIVAIMPWNPALWWQLRRLRGAIEMDCDERVLRDGADALSYSKALVAVGSRATRGPLAGISMAEPVSDLERRIRAMMTEAPRRLKVFRAGSALALALAITGLSLVVNAPVAQERRSTPAVRSQTFEMLSEANSCFADEDYTCTRSWLANVRQTADLNDYEAAVYWEAVARLESSLNRPAQAAAAYESLLRLPVEQMPVGLRRRALYSLGALYAADREYDRAYEQLNEMLALDGVTADSNRNQSASPALAIVKVRPSFPEAATERGLNEGHVDLYYTVTEAGEVTDVAVIASSSPVFETPAVDAARKFKYRPKVEDGESVAVGIRERIDLSPMN